MDNAGGELACLGFLAASAIEAVLGRVRRLRDDQRRARVLYARLSRAFGALAGEVPDTITVLLESPPDIVAGDLAAALRVADVLALLLNRATLRFVVHAALMMTPCRGWWSPRRRS